MTAMRARDNVADIYPLGPLQQGILSHALRADGRDPYLVSLCFRLRGRLDPDALEAAWQVVVDRHEAMRADLDWTRAREPVQIVYRECPVTLDRRSWVEPDAADAGGASGDARLRALLAEEAARFDLARAADRRPVLVETGSDEWLLVWIFHHVLLDGWSVANVLAEVLAAYRARVAGEPLELPEVTPHGRYLDWLRGRDVAAAEDHFRAALAGHDPIDFPRSPAAAAPGAAAGARFAERSLVLDDAASAALRELARRARVTLATCFHAALAAVLRGHTGRDDVVFGATTAGRPSELAGSTAMVGAFLNTLPVRVRVRDAAGVTDWLEALHREAGRRQAFEHLGLPRVLELAGQGGRALFETILVFESFPVPEALDAAEDGPLSVELHRAEAVEEGATVGRGRNHYPLTVVVLPGRRLEVILATHRDRVSDDLAAAILARLGAALRALPGAGTVGALLDATAAAVGDPVGLVGPPAIEEPRLVHERIAAWCRATPEAIAVRCEDDAITWAELDERAARLAGRLRRRGVGAGDRVGVCLDRSIDFVVALLAALRAGAAYVPLEPGPPRERLGALVADARLAALITRRAHLPAVEAVEGAGPPIVLVDEPRDVAGSDTPDAPATAPVAALHADSPAYLIYTSGSTGRPKGVVVSHAALDRYVHAVADRLGLPERASLAMVSTVAADLGHTALFGALCRGGTLHLLTEARVHDPHAFAEYMERHGIDALKIVPGHLAGLLDAERPERALPVHTLVLGGEAASPDLVRRLRAQRRCRVVNHYGPTETTVGVLTHGLGDGEGLPLGRPLAGARAHLLGDDLRPAPVGASGEIFIGGGGLAGGYFDRPGATADRFVPDPFAPPGEAGARLYRTGDRGRLRPDGAIELLGRVDHQVKVRGHRVELGEVEAALAALPGVTAARVVVRPGPGGARLVGYLVGREADAGDVRAALRDRLPEPMIPADIVRLDRMPVTANGKLDAAALPDPDPAASPGRELATDAERTLAAIWAEVLGRDRVGPDDDFFRLGGDSILALKVVSRARRAGLAIGPRQLHAASTLAAAAAAARPIAARPAAAPAAAGGPALLTPVQRAFLARQTVDPHHFNQALLLEVAPAVDVGLIERALALVTRPHDALRLRFQRAPAGWTAWIAGEIAAPVVERIDLSGAARPAEAIERACDALQRGFDLATGPLFRAAHLDLGPGRGARLFLVAHHLVVDGVSWRILLEDLAEAAVALAAGRRPDLAPPATSFRRWTELLHERAGSEALRAELPRWREAAGARAASPPSSSSSGPSSSSAGWSRPPARGTVGDAAAVSDDLDEAETAALLSFAPAAVDARASDVLLAALAATLCRAWRAPDLAITVEGHGREDVFDADPSRTVGWLATTYPVRLAPDPAGDRAATIRAVRDRMREVPAGGIGYGLIRDLAGDPALAAAEPPRVTFNYLGQLDGSFSGHALFEVASEPSGARRSPASPRDGWFVVNAVVYAGRLRVDWEYSRELHAEAEVTRLLADFLAELRAAIASAPGSP